MAGIHRLDTGFWPSPATLKSGWRPLPGSVGQFELHLLRQLGGWPGQHGAGAICSTTRDVGASRFSSWHDLDGLCDALTQKVAASLDLELPDRDCPARGLACRHALEANRCEFVEAAFQITPTMVLFKSLSSDCAESVLQTLLHCRSARHEHID